MTTKPFPPFGAAHVPCVGRYTELEALVRALCKPTPDNLSLVAPKRIGKTTLVRQLAATFKQRLPNFAAVIYIDLLSTPPRSDADFRHRIATELKNQLPGDAGTLVALDQDDTVLSEQIVGVFEYMAQEHPRWVLVILDGLDLVLDSSDITPNLWDYLRALADTSGSCRFLTVTRKSLREALANEQSLASRFWNCFADPPQTLGPFATRDHDAVAQPWRDRGCTVEPSAIKELGNWTGWHPNLVSYLGNLVEPDSGGIIAKPNVDDAAAEALLQKGNPLMDVWQECDLELRGLLHELASGNAVKPSAAQSAFMVARGILPAGPAPLPPLAKLIAQLALDHGRDHVDLRRHFAKPDAYVDSMKTVLAVRLGQVASGDRKLTMLIAKAIQRLGSDADDVLRLARDIFDRAAELAWLAEAPAGHVPLNWIAEWKQAGLVTEIERYEREKVIPEERGRQCALLRLATGRQRIRPVATKVTKATVVLLEHIQQVGDFANHNSGDVPASFGVAVCAVAVELLDSLAMDLA